MRCVTSGCGSEAHDGGVIAAAVLLVLPLAAGAVPRPTMPPTPPDIAMKMSALFAKATPAVRAWVDAEARKLRPIPRIDLPMVSADARQGFPSAAPPLTPAQADVLAAMALYQTAKDLESLYVTRDKAHDQKDGLHEMSPQDLLELQQMMDRKKQLEAMISSVLRSAAFEAGQGVVSTLKAS